MASGRGVQRVLAKLKASLDEGNYYEAHQMYRTLYFRYNSQKKYAEAIDLLYNGSLALLNANQHASGTDLALLLIETLQKSVTPPEQEYLEKVGSLHQLMIEDGPERQQFVAATIHWSTGKDKQSGRGHPSLHQQFAVNLWNERNYAQSRFHYLRSCDGAGCASMLVEYHITSGFPSEVDIFLAQAVLQFLCLENRVSAQDCFNSYTKQHPQVESGPPFVRPIFNFLWLLLLACDGGTVTVFTILLEQYQPTLKRDPSYLEYLDRIGQLFFGLPPPETPRSSGLFGNLINSLFATEAEEDGTDLSDRPCDIVELD